jgi:PleD family two-component response regulator
VAERLRSAVAAEDFTPDGKRSVWKSPSVSGVTQYRQEEEISSFVQRADQAMYLSKQAGRNRVSCLFASVPK